jgi:predicted glycoside hydrolase/deacetylase ChbG (UPF0249 family)
MKLIVNADDFGFSKQLNDDIIKCHKKGIVTSATILANGEYFDDAVALSKQNPHLGIGVHLAIDGPFNIGKSYNTLLVETTGEFYDETQIVEKIRNGTFKHSELVEEYSMQIEKVMDAGIKITHLDHHHHLHLYFPILNAIIEVGKKYKILFIRPQKILHETGTSLIKKIYRWIHHEYLLLRHKTVDGYTSFESLETHEMNDKFKSILASKNKTIELVVHPLKENGELDFLIDDKVIAAAQSHLINYGQLK